MTVFTFQRYVRHYFILVFPAFCAKYAVDIRDIHCTKNWIYTNLLVANMCKKVQTRGKSKAKVVNTAFACQFTWGCKFGGKCDIYHLCLLFNLSLHFFAPNLY